MTDASTLADWDRSVFWHAFTQMAEYEPLIIERGEGVWLFDVEGNRYLDGVSSLWCNLHGHRHPRIDAAIAEQLTRLGHATTLGMSNPPAIELAKRLAGLAPGNLNHVFFCCDGSSAVEAALKASFQYWRQIGSPRPDKTKFLALGDAYHGDTLGSTAVGGIQQFHRMFQPLLCDVIRLPSPDRRGPNHGGDPVEACAQYLAELEHVLQERGDEIAALVIEPLVQGAAGMIMQPPGYLSGVRELTRKYDVLMIADEIVTGFGRTGKMFACEHEQVVPDLLCLGKSLTGGYLPMSAMIATTDVFDAFQGAYAEQKTFYHGHTFGGNPLAAAAALASIDVLDDEQIIAEQLPGKIETLRLRLAPLASHPHVADVRQLGMLAGIELAADPDSGASFPPEQRVGCRVCKEATQRGVWLRPLGDVVIVMPPYAASDDEIELLGRVLRESLDHVCAEVTQPV